MSGIDDNVWMNNIIDIVGDFASQEFQERAWLRGEGTEVSSFVESYCQFFDSVPHQLIDEEWQQVGLTKTQRDKLATFTEALEKFGSITPTSPTHAEVLGHPEWPKIRQLAKAALDSFKGSKWEHKQRAAT